MIDWKIVFSTRMNHYIFIKHKNDSDYLDFFYTHQYEIEKEPTFFFLIPNIIELHNKDANEYVTKYAPLLKKFMDSPNKKTLFAEEDVLKAIIKEEKRGNFFKFLSKNKRNIVLFCHDNLDENAKSDDHLYTYLSEEDLKFHISLFTSFKSIRSAIKNTHNPFKDPTHAYNKIKEEY